jgi:hypothetical protein
VKSPDRQTGPQGVGRSDDAKASFAHFVGSPGYDVADLCADIGKFAFLLGGNDGEHLLA